MSDPIVRRTLDARIDLAGCYAWIWEQSPDAAFRFRRQAEETFKALARDPGIGAPCPITNPHLAGVRCARVRRFKNHLIFYRPVAHGIEVIRVLHAARDAINILEAGEY
jgi:toxin ParE1/3/4